jgi:hypothetical protein
MVVRRGQSFVFIYFDTVITGVAVRDENTWQPQLGFVFQVHVFQC